MNVTAPQRADFGLPETRPNPQSPQPKAPVPAGTPNAPEQLQLSGAAKQNNPYAGVAPGSTNVQVQPWGSGENDSLEGILQAQGYSRKEMYRQDGEGRTLIDRVVQQNGLRNPNLLSAGRQLLVPSKHATPAPTETAGAQPAATSPHPTPARREQTPGDRRVTVDSWGKGPNSSLEGILRGQGYSSNEIYRKDGQGRTLIDRFAAQNGLTAQSKLRAGQSLQLPGQGGKTPPQQAPVQQAPPQQAPVQQAPPQQVPVQQAQAPAPPVGEPTAEMGLLLSGVKDNHFTRDEFQALNSMANRYEELRARFGRDGYSNDELKTLGNYERRYGEEYNRLYNGDDTRIVVEAGDPTNPDTQRRMQMYRQGGDIYDGYKGGHLSADDAVRQMMQQRAQSRQGGAQ